MRLIGAQANRSPSFGKRITALFMTLALGVGCAGESGDEPVREAAEEANYVPLPPPVMTVTSPPATVMGPPPTIDVTRSLAITDLPTLGAVDAQGKLRFSLYRVLQKLGTSSKTDKGNSPSELYQRIFDTNNTKAGGFVADGQHCDDQKDAHGNAILNGFPIECPRQEGQLANLAEHNPFCSGPNCDPYTPIAITNRFDLAPENGQTCGQYRIVFGKGVNDEPLKTAGNPFVFNRNLIIFEAIVPNARPDLGLKGCSPVVGLWYSLSKIADPAKRAALLDQFFFSGIPGFPAALDFSHFRGTVDPHTGVQTSGQIRGNQFLFDKGGQNWQLREYNTERSCKCIGLNTVCTAKIRMVTTKENPAATLFDDNDTSPRALAFRDPANPSGFLSQVSELARNDLNRLNFKGLSPSFNGGESTSSPAFSIPGQPPPTPQNDTNYNMVFRASGPFAAAIQTELDKIGSPLTPVEIVRRAQTQACAGCHLLSTSASAFFGGALSSNDLGPNGPGQTPLIWPDVAPGPDADPGPDVVRANAFTQISEAVLDPLAPGVVCDTACTAHPTTCQCEWAISAALKDVFLPFRREIMSKFITTHQGPH
ncbi:Hypothetical protein A7982_06392 [Minicystis rosea]|nr:Hypothetical protein A7982_06392 [Minicystis rosea]